MAKIQLQTFPIHDNVTFSSKSLHDHI